MCSNHLSFKIMKYFHIFQVYDLGADGQGMSRVATMSQSSIVAAAGNIARHVLV